MQLEEKHRGISVRKIASVLLLLVFSSTAGAAIVTIDFDGAQNPFDPITGYRVMTVPQGFTVTNNNVFATSTSATGCFGPPLTVGPNDPENYYCTLAVAPSVPLQVDFTNDAGLEFSLLELDVYIVERAEFFPVGDELSFAAWDESGNLIAERVLRVSEEGFGWRTLQFGPEWSGISKLTYNPQEDYFESGTFAYLDNVKLNVVPIPAAVWLFGSALLGLGWLRKSAF
jgi:hypothetical protein